MYKFLQENYKICVVPDERIQTITKLPYFSIIEDDFANMSTIWKTKGKANHMFDAKFFKSNIDFFTHINKESINHLKKGNWNIKDKNFFSPSLRMKKGGGP